MLYGNMCICLHLCVCLRSLCGMPTISASTSSFCSTRRAPWAEKSHPASGRSKLYAPSSRTWRRCPSASPLCLTRISAMPATSNSAAGQIQKTKRICRVLRLSQALWWHREAVIRPRMWPAVSVRGHVIEFAYVGCVRACATSAHLRTPRESLMRPLANSHTLAQPPRRSGQGALSREGAVVAPVSAHGRRPLPW